MEEGKRAGVDVMMITKAACRPGVRASNQPSCDEFTSIVRKLVVERRPDLVLLSARWNIRDPKVGATGTSVAESAIELATELRREGLNVAILGPPVQYLKPLPEALLGEGPLGVARFDTSEIFLGGARKIDDTMKQVLAGTGIPLISVLDATCSERKCKTVYNNRPMAWDVHHLTQEGSEFLAAKIFPQIEGMLEKPNRVGQYNPSRD